MEQEAEPLLAGEVRDVLLATRDEVVDADDLVAASEQRVAQVRAEEPRTAGDHDPSHQLRPIP